MTTLSNQNLLQQLNWRYATKKFDPTRKIPAADWQTLENALVLSPSSFGLQPYKFVLVQDPATRAKLVGAAWGQQQVVDASHLVVFAAKRNLQPADVERFVDRIAQVRGVTRESLAPYRGMMMGALFESPLKNFLEPWATRQVYLALGNLLTCAAVLGIDACPMEGFEPPKIDEILGLGPQGLASVVMCTLGYRAPDDKYAATPKVRLPAEELFVRR